MKRVFARCLLVLMCLGVCGAALAEGYVMAIPPQYDDGREFSEGLAAVRVGEWGTEKWGFIDKAGKEVISLQYDYAGDFHDGLAVVMVDDGETSRWGFIDKTGKEVVSPQYGEVGDFRDGLATVRVGDEETGKWGFINGTGKEVVPPRYDSIGDWFDDEAGFHDGLAMVWIGDRETDWFQNAGKWGFIDKAGEEVVPVEYDKVGRFREGLVGVIKDGLLGFVDETGAVVIPLTYVYDNPWFSVVESYQMDFVPFFSEGLAAIWGGDAHNGQYGYIDKEGNVVIPFAYDYAAPFSEGLAYVSEGGALVFDDPTKDGKYGFIDKTGEVVVPLVYDCDYSDCGGIILEQYFYDGFAKASKGTVFPTNMKYGMIDRTGTVVVPMAYDWVWHHGWHWNFYGRLALVGLGWDRGGWESRGLVDETGKEVVAVGYYDDIGPFSEGLARVWHGASKDEYGQIEYGTGAYGFIDTTGKEVVPCIFDNARDFSEGLAAVLVDGKWGYIAIAE